MVSKKREGERIVEEKEEVGRLREERRERMNWR